MELVTRMRLSAATSRLRSARKALSGRIWRAPGLLRRYAVLVPWCAEEMAMKRVTRSMPPRRDSMKVNVEAALAEAGAHAAEYALRIMQAVHEHDRVGGHAAGGYFAVSVR